ncbi:MAG: hypothetical protein V7752_18580 [Halopseudomonas sp.]
MTPKLMIQRLHQVLEAQGTFAVAVSGGVDSMTLAYLAHRLLPESVSMYHAGSAAVPRDAAERVRRYAHQEGWAMEWIDAAELTDREYIRNPVNRCYYCKSCLYSTISSRTSASICSGTNIDDLSDYRPGLEAAKEHKVSHPYVEAGINKEGVRAVARSFGLDDLADLPASPCLASRIETGISIKRDDLELVDRVENCIRSYLPSAEDVRCRVRPKSVEIEMNEQQLQDIGSIKTQGLLDYLYASFPELSGTAVRITPYCRGSGFIHVA